jgi:UDP-N-acetylglucosamine diphosphorylase/glucosamine-1-phosphate N-acetyltransferase
LPYVPLLFEDHTLAGFRPLSWSMPVGELRCGLLNPRERVTLACGEPPVLLLRSFLEELARDVGHAVGPAAVREALARAGADRALWLSPRLGADWRLLDTVTRRLLATDDAFAIRDAAGLLAAAVPAAELESWLAAWNAWRETAEARGCWRDPADIPPAWEPPELAEATLHDGAWRRIWDLVPATAAAIGDDLARLEGRLPGRRIWGAVPEQTDAAVWTAPVPLQTAPQRGCELAGLVGEAADLWLGPGCELARDVAVDTRGGPVVLGAGVRVMPHAYLEGPLHVGSGSIIKAGAAIYGETSLGVVTRIGGEVGESTFLDLANKQHEGFIGHAYIGSWCNLGALTTNSDLKNTYGTIRVDLGAGPEDSGQRFVGVMMGEHAKTAIGTLLNTGTTVGFASNVFGSGFPDKRLPCFTWGDGRGDDRHDPQRALATARTVMARRGCRTTAGHEAVFRALA